MFDSDLQECYLIVILVWKAIPDVILFNFLLFIYFMFISKVFKLQFPECCCVCWGCLMLQYKKFNWEDTTARGNIISSSQVFISVLIEVDMMLCDDMT